MEIPNPRRILILSDPSISLTPLLSALIPPPAPSSSNLTSTPPSASTSTSNPTPAPAPPSKIPPTTQLQEPEQEQIHHITTPYYKASIPIWTDIITSAAEWKEEWLSLPGAEDVVSSIGAWVVAFACPTRRRDLTEIQTLLKTVASVLQHHTQNNYDTDGAAVFAVALPRGEVSGLKVEEEEWEDLCRDAGGWEFIDGSVVQGIAKRNEFGETTGFPRLLEALAANDWESGAGDAPSPDLDLDLDYKDIDQEDNPEALLNGIEDPESREMRVPMIPRGAGNGEEGIGAEDADREGNGDDGDREGEGEEDSVEALQTLLLKMQAVKDLGADLPAAERRKLARRAVAEVMRGA